MEGIFVWLWIISIAIFRDYFWLTTIAIIVAYLVLKYIVKIVKSISYRRTENRKYRGILRTSISKVQNINLTPYQDNLSKLEKLYDVIYSSSKIILKNKKGNVVNICSKCGGYMRIVKGWKGSFLGCSNYPRCSSKRNYSEIFNIEI